MLKTRLLVVAAVCLVPSPPDLARATPAAQDGTQEVETQSLSASVLSRALAEFEQGRVESAISILEEVGSGQLSDPRIAAVLGALYVDAGRHAEALAVLTPLTEDENADVAVLYNAGRAAAALEQYDRAQRLLEASVAAFPTSPAARELGFVHLRQGRFMDAYLWLKPWCRRNPSDAEAVTAAASCAVNLGRGAEAEQLLGLLPNEAPEVKLLWATALLLKGDAWSALAVAKELAQEGPEELEPHVLTLLADIYTELDQPALVVEALTGKTAARPLVAVRLSRALRRLEELDQALELLRPFSRGLVEDDPEVGRWLPGMGSGVALEYGLLLAAAGRHQEAVPFLRASTDLSRGDAEAWRALAISLNAIGDEAGGRDAVARADRIDRVAGVQPATGAEQDTLGTDPTAQRLRGAQALLGFDAQEEALRIAREERTLVPEDPRPPLVEAQMLTSLGRSDAALAVLDTAQTSFPANADVHYYRGVVQMSLGQLDVAEESLDRAIALAPQHTPALTDLALLLIELNRRDEARELVERVLAISPGDPTASGLLEQLQTS